MQTAFFAGGARPWCTVPSREERRAPVEDRNLPALSCERARTGAQKPVALRTSAPRQRPPTSRAGSTMLHRTPCLAGWNRVAADTSPRTPWWHEKSMLTPETSPRIFRLRKPWVGAGSSSSRKRREKPRWRCEKRTGRLAVRLPCSAASCVPCGSRGGSQQYSGAPGGEQAAPSGASQHRPGGAFVFSLPRWTLYFSVVTVVTVQYPEARFLGVRSTPACVEARKTRQDPGLGCTKLPTRNPPRRTPAVLHPAHGPTPGRTVYSRPAGTGLGTHDREPPLLIAVCRMHSRLLSLPRLPPISERVSAASAASAGKQQHTLSRNSISSRDGPSPESTPDFRPPSPLFPPPPRHSWLCYTRTATYASSSSESSGSIHLLCSPPSPPAHSRPSASRPRADPPPLAPSPPTPSFSSPHAPPTGVLVSAE